MTLYNIPKILEKGYKILNELSAEDKLLLLNTCKGLKLGSSIDNITDTLKDVFKEKLTPLEIDSIFHVIFSYTSLLNIDKDIDNIAQTLTDSLNSHFEDELIFESAFTEFTKHIFGLNNLFISLRAYEYLNDQSNIFVDTIIHTDIRTLFDQKDENSMDLGIVFHKLKVEYRNGQKSEQMIFTLENKDLELLKKAIEIAENRESSIKNKFENLGFYDC